MSKHWLKKEKNTPLIALILAILYGLVSIVMIWFKYSNFFYTSLDLAIINNVFFHTSFGDLYHMSIHPNLYLAEHFNPILVLLTPFYTLFRSPVTLLVLQVLAVASATIPLHHIAKKSLPPMGILIVLAMFLFNPLTLNLTLFEFHLLPFAIPLLLATFYYYSQKRYIPFAIFFVLSLLVREDVSLFLFVFAIIAIIERRSWKWIVPPAIISLGYFIVAMKVIGSLAVTGKYIFLIYYGWLGTSLPEIAIHFFTRFHLVLLHIANMYTLELVLGLLLSFLFVPLFRPKYLLFSLPIFLQLVLGNTSGAFILRTHYSTLLLVALLLAFIPSLTALQQSPRMKKINKTYTGLFPFVGIVAFIYIFLQLGPVMHIAKAAFALDQERNILRREFIQEIGPEDSVVAPYSLLANLSSRKQLYPLHYTYIGVQKFNMGPYEIPDDTRYILIDTDDLIEYQLQFTSRPLYQEAYANAPTRFSELLSRYGIKRIEKEFVLLEKNYSSSNFLYRLHSNLLPIANQRAQHLGEALTFNGFTANEDHLSLFFSATDKITETYFLKINGHYFPLGYGVYPTQEWIRDSIVEIPLYGYSKDDHIEVVAIKGDLELGGFGETYIAIDEEQTLGTLQMLTASEQ